MAKLQIKKAIQLLLSPVKIKVSKVQLLQLNLKRTRIC